MATIADLNINIGVSGVQNLSKGLETASKSVGQLGKETDAASKKINASTANTEKSFSGIKNSLNGISGAIAGAFTVGAILQFGSAVINTTANFQKMEAVLTNTLGSSSAAQNAMLMIQDIAAKTPFSVEQLTGSFVKLANRGIVPTGAEIIKLGDLAASTGKEFDMLTEALLDSMTGEFERLKEFGITASAQGDKVAFTFKGVTTEVAKTDTAIKDYVISLGDAKGVSGSMAAISETLGGKISNLGDSFDQLFLTIGKGTKGILNSAVDGLNKYVQFVTTAFKDINDLKLERISKSTKDYLAIIGNPKTVQEFADSYTYLNNKIEETTKAQIKERKELEKLQSIQANTPLSGRLVIDEKVEKQKNVVASFGFELQALDNTFQKLNEKQAAFLNAKTVAPKIVTLESLKAKLKSLEDQQETLNLSDTKGLASKNREIEALTKLIAEYEKLGTAKGAAAAKIANFKDINPTKPNLSLNLSSGGEEGEGGNPLYTSISEAADRSTESVNRLLTALGLVPPAYVNVGGAVAAYREDSAEVQAINLELAESFQNHLLSNVENLAVSLGNLFTGDGGAAAFFKNIISLFADFAGKYGALTVALGVAKNAALPGSGVADIAAGKALMVASGVVKAAASFIGSGSKSGSPTGPRPSYNSPANQTRNDYAGPGSNGGNTVKFEIEGTKLVGVIRNQGLKDGR